jgi:Skp family chaperone for outer membrane proteins
VTEPVQNPLEQTVARHEEDIASLRAEIAAIKEGHAKQQLEAKLAQRMAELEADIHLQQLQETIDQEQQQAEKNRHRGFFRRH